ncbi:MAG TPA: hypothetical protein VN843_07515, partial [Anaerolineales bacterium]|nr:hypothetical protein [Anaerolineales bacterium]
MTSSSLRHTIPLNKIQKTLTRTSTFQSDFQRAEWKWCERGKSAEAEWTSEFKEKVRKDEYQRRELHP